MNKNPLLELQTLGQSIWIDFIRRGMIFSGELQRLIEEDGVSGVTSNPSIFETAIAGSHDYDEAILTLTRKGKTPEEIYQALTVDDIRLVADLLRGTYEATEGGDGFVSLEVSPHLAYDTDGTVEEARRLWCLVDRPNLMIKVPATRPGIPAVQELTSEGINVNITLLFGLNRYQEVADAYITGLEELAGQGGHLEQIRSVASFFLSRIDVLLDPVLEKKGLKGKMQAGIAERLRGRAAIASAKIAYQLYKEIFSSDRFQELSARGAQPQRLLWASTSTKDPAYSDTKYIEPLVGADTINTMPAETLAAYREHGQPQPRLEENISRAYHILGEVSSLGIDLDAATQQLEEQGVQKFVSALDRLMIVLQAKQAAVNPMALGSPNT